MDADCSPGDRAVANRKSGKQAGKRTSEQMSAEDLEKYETEMELSLYREYKDIVGQFSYVVETERRFYLANSVEMVPRNADGEVYFELRLSDAWVWDMYRPARFVKQVRVVTFKDVNIEEVEKPELRLPNSYLPDGNSCSPIDGRPPRRSMTSRATSANLMFRACECRRSRSNASSSVRSCSSISMPTALPISRLLSSPRRRLAASSPCPPR